MQFLFLQNSVKIEADFKINDKFSKIYYIPYWK